MRVALVLYFITSTCLPMHHINAATGQDTVKVKGVLLDFQDARATRATVTFKNGILDRKTYSNDEGIFEIRIPIGTYEFSVQSYGFKTYKIEALEIKADGAGELKVELEPEPVKGPHEISGIFVPIKLENAPIPEKIPLKKIP
jgi:hypothetical protein